MASLADNLIPPYYAAIIETPPHRNDNEPASEADVLVSYAVQRPGFLGLETATGMDGRPLTVAYWRDLADVEGWTSAGHANSAEKFPLEVRRVSNPADEATRALYTVEDDSKVTWRYT